MNLRVFLINESKHLEPSSQTTCFESFRDGKSYYWIDVEDPDPASLKEFLEQLDVHSLIMEEYLEPAGTSRVDLYRQSLFIRFSVQLALDTRGQPFFPLFVSRKPSLPYMKDPALLLRISPGNILSAVFMPLSLIAGIYAMNFRYMPELTW